jgi:hypothetical protein
MRRMLIFLLLLFFSGSAFGLSAVSPGSYEVEYEQGFSGEFVFEFILDGSSPVDLSVEGDFAQYVTLDKEVISGRESVTVFLDLPSGIDSFGVNQIFIRAGDARAVIKVDAPYPDRYLAVDLVVPSVNKGENVDVELRLLNLADDSIFADYHVNVYSDDVLIKSFDNDSVRIEPSRFLDLSFDFPTFGYSPGDYEVVAFVEYDGELRRFSNSFGIGEFSVGVLNYSDEFLGGEVAGFEIGVRNLWNNDMVGVYADVLIDDKVIFSTVPISLNAWEESSLSGFFDTGRMRGNVDGEIVLHYVALGYDDDIGSSSESIRLKIKRNYKAILYCMIGLVVFFFICWVVFLIIEWILDHYSEEEG